MTPNVVAEQQAEPTMQSDESDPMSNDTAGPKGLAKRILGPFERRLDFVVARAVDHSMQQQAIEIQEALREGTGADVSEARLRIPDPSSRKLERNMEQN